MKLMVLNIWQGRLAKNVVRLLEREQPDTVCLQEVCSSERDYGGFFPGDSLEMILEKQPYEHVFFAPTLDFKLMHGQVAFGNAILSRQPLLQRSIHFTHGQFTPDFDFQDNIFYNHRNFQYAQIEHNEQAIHLINFHGYHLTDPQGDEESVNGVQQLADFAAQLAPGPLLIAGDFNVNPTSPALEPLKQYDNLVMRAKPQSTLTSLAYSDTPDGVCDFIFTRDINAKQLTIPEYIASDHKALFLEFDVSAA